MIDLRRYQLLDRPLARLLRALPTSPPAALVQGTARAYARVATRTGVPLFRGARTWPERLGALLGQPLARADKRRTLVEVFALKALNWVDGRRPDGVRLAVRDLRVEGREHLTAALEGGRGVVLVSGHYGFPPALGPLLAASGIRWVALRAWSARGERDTAVPIGRTAWSRARALREVRRALRHNHAGIALADAGRGVAVTVPFLHGAVAVSLGPFALARTAGCPVLPFFALARAEGGFRVVFHPPLPAGGTDARADQAAAAAFAEVFARQVRADPAQLWWRRRV